MTAEASFFGLHDLDDLGVVCLSVHFGEVKSAQVAVADLTVQHDHESVMASLCRGESEAVPRALRSAKEGSGHELERGRVNFDIGSSVGLTRHCGRRRRGGCPRVGPDGADAGDRAESGLALASSSMGCREDVAVFAKAWKLQKSENIHLEIWVRLRELDITL